MHKGLVMSFCLIDESIKEEYRASEAVTMTDNARKNMREEKLDPTGRPHC